MLDKQFFKKLFQFEGKIDRLDYFYRIIPAVAFALILKTLEPSSFSFFTAIILILWIASLWLWVCAVVQRLHDLHRPGSHFWLGCIPLYDVYFGCVLLFRKGIGGPNEYGTELKTKSAEPPAILQQKKKVPIAFNMILTPLFFWLAIAVLFVVFITVLSLNSQKTTNETIATTQPPANTATITPPTQKPIDQPITNPEYLADPSSFSVDRQNIVLVDFPINTPVWVENIINETNLQISYSIVIAGKNILKIQKMGFGHLFGYFNINNSSQTIPVLQILKLQNRYPIDMKSFIDCIRQATVSYMENNINHHYVEVGSLYPSAKQDPILAKITPLAGSPITMNGNNLEQQLVVNGFGIGGINYFLNPNIHYYPQQEQVAILSNAGMWGVCLPKQ